MQSTSSRFVWAYCVPGRLATSSDFILPTVPCGGCHDFLLSRMRKLAPGKVQEGTTKEESPPGLQCSLPVRTFGLQGPLPGRPAQHVPRPAGRGGRGLGCSHTSPRGSPAPQLPHTHFLRRCIIVDINLKQYECRGWQPTRPLNRASRCLAFEGREHHELSLAFLLICYSIKKEKKIGEDQ